MTIERHETHHNMRMHLFCDDNPQSIVHYGENEPPIQDLAIGGKAEGLTLQIETHRLIGFIGFQTADDFNLYRLRHSEIKTASDETRFPYTIYISPSKTGIYIFRRQDVEDSNVKTKEREFEDYIQYMDAHWEDTVVLAQN